ncbi:hypothetical protein ONE63_001277 [Megalurothrips usitatus]|uniref:Gustatory receptor n=1 Tax=Megalurothrips usitatus TaxID=439358 RepID=A0AAV7XFS4_9NEOP|nr:hypothetical protein ONE63_001277 [Megalurothrips usitatus]
MVVTSLQESETLHFKGNMGAHACAVSIALLYLRLARRWRPFSLLFLRIEDAVEDDAQDAVVAGTEVRMRRVTLIVFGCALFEHSFDRISLVTSIMKVNHYESLRALLDDSLFQRPFAEAFTTAFTHATATIMAFLYIFNDAFVILVSVYISMRVESFNGHLDPVLTKKKDVTFWERARRSYDDLAKLTRDADSYINTNIFVSFVQNFFFICFQLLYFLRSITDEGLLRNTFRIFSFSYVLVRTYMISYFAAGINDHSKLARTKLFSVSSRSYCREVHRFLQQAANDEMAVTGCNFFRITRAFILTVAGTIVTYEVILLQINPH